MINHVNNINDFLTHIATIAVFNSDIQITKKLVYGELIMYSLYNNKPVIVDGLYEKLLTAYRSKKNTKAYIPSNWRTYCHISSVNPLINHYPIKIFIPLKKEYISKNIIAIFDFLDKENIKHQSTISNIISSSNIIIRVDNLGDANKIAGFIYNNDNIKKYLNKPNPFLFTDGLVGYVIDNSLSFNVELSEYIANYINYLKKSICLFQAGLDSFREYLIKLYNDTFVTGKNLDKFIINKQIQSNLTLSLKEHMSMLETIITILDRKSSAQSLVSLYDNLNNIGKECNGYNYLKQLLKKVNIVDSDKLINGSNAKKKILMEAVFETNQKYGAEFVKNSINEYVNKYTPRRFTRENGIRDYMKNYMTPLDVYNIIKNRCDGIFDINKFVNEVISINMDELKEEVLEKASISTYKKYGKKQLAYAIDLALKGNYGAFSKEGRSSLILDVKYTELEKIIKGSLFKDKFPPVLIDAKYKTLYIEKIIKKSGKKEDK